MDTHTFMLINDYTEQKECQYKDEHYLVRDNGAVFRCKKQGACYRKLDEQWTFGTKNAKTGYMTIGGHRVHIIVATAFYGSRDSKIYVVDHIDTNRCNNRSENLRWFTRLENALNNPVTRKRIEYLCGGDIQRFIDDPGCLRDITGTNQDVMWMRTVSKEEAQSAYKRVMEWAQKTSVHSERSKGIGEWIYKSTGTEIKKFFSEQINRVEYVTSRLDSVNSLSLSDDSLTDSLTPNAKQKNWKTPTEFPLCPSEDTDKPLNAYLNNLANGLEVSRSKYSVHYVDDFALYNENLLVIRTHTYNSVKDFAVMHIVFKDGKYVHEGKTYFEEIGAMKAFALAIGKTWNGPDGVDDYC